MRENISTFTRVAGEVAGRIIAERDEATVLANELQRKGDIVMEFKAKGRRDGLQRAFDLLVEEGVIVP